QADRQRVRIGGLVGRHQYRADRGEGVERLADHPLLAFLLELPVAGRDVVTDRVAGDVANGVCRLEVPPALADDDYQLGLEIDFLAPRRQHNIFAVADQRRRVLAEEDRLLGYGGAAFDGVVAVVQAETNNLGRVGDRGQELDRVGRVAHGVGPPRRLLRR